MDKWRDLWLPSYLLGVMAFFFLVWRNARASISPGWGGFPFQPIPGGGGNEPQGCPALGKSIGYADGHHLKTLPTLVRFFLCSSYSIFILVYLFIEVLILAFLFNCSHQACLTSPICVEKWQSSAFLRLFTDSGKRSLEHSTSQRETFLAYRCLYVSCQVFNIWLSCFINLQTTFLFVCFFQYSVSLQSEEEIQQQYQRRPGQTVSVTGHGRHMESCLHTASSHFSLPIPLNVTPGFSTDIGQLPVTSFLSQNEFVILF